MAGWCLWLAFSSTSDLSSGRFSRGPRPVRASPARDCPPCSFSSRSSCRAILKQAHTAGCQESSKELGELFRLDAKAEGDDVAVGGWLSRDGAAVGDAPWFAVRLTRVTAPWAFARGETFRVIASLELLGALLGVMILLLSPTLRAPPGRRVSSPPPPGRTTWAIAFSWRSC